MCKTGRGMSTSAPGTLRACPAMLVRRCSAAWSWSPASRLTCKLFGAPVSLPPAPHRMPLFAYAAVTKETPVSAACHLVPYTI